MRRVLVVEVYGVLIEEPREGDIGFVPGRGQTSTLSWERRTNPFVCDMLFEDEE